MSHTWVFIFIVISYMSVVISDDEIDYTVFFSEDAPYDRICSYHKDLLKYEPNSLCRRLARMLDSQKDANEINQVSGKCKSIDVRLKDDRVGSRTLGELYAVATKIVLCQIAENYQKCISASRAGNAVEHFDYKKGTSGNSRCTHTGQMIIAQ